MVEISLIRRTHIHKQAKENNTTHEKDITHAHVHNKTESACGVCGGGVHHTRACVCGSKQRTRARSSRSLTSRQCLRVWRKGVGRRMCAWLVVVMSARNKFLFRPQFHSTRMRESPQRPIRKGWSVGWSVGWLAAAVVTKGKRTHASHLSAPHARFARPSPPRVRRFKSVRHTHTHRDPQKRRQNANAMRCELAARLSLFC